MQLKFSEVLLLAMMVFNSALALDPPVAQPPSLQGIGQSILGDEQSDSIMSSQEVEEKSIAEDEAIVEKREKEWQVQKKAKTAKINKFLSLNYRVQPFPVELYRDAGPEEQKNNSHLPGPIYRSDLERQAFDMVASADLEHLRAILDHYVSINAYNEHGNSLLIHAVLSGQVDSARLLLAKGAIVGATDKDGSTALHIAVIKGYKDIAQALVIMGANPLLVDNFGKTALDYATNKNDQAMIALIGRNNMVPSKNNG